MKTGKNGGIKEEKGRVLISRKEGRKGTKQGIMEGRERKIMMEVIEEKKMDDRQKEERERRKS